MADITLVTVTYNAASVWAPFMASMLAQQGVDWHLVVIDNQSRDGTIDMLRAIDDPRVTLVLNDGNRGVAAANNQGIRIGLDRGSDRIVLLNNDTEFAPDLLARMAAQMDRLGADALSPLIPFFDAPDRVWYGGGSFERRRGVMNRHDHYHAPITAIAREPFATDYAPTCCVMFRASVFADVGMMDERYFVYWDDTDFMWRMKIAGKRLFLDPTTLFYHKVSVSTGGRHSDFSIRYNFRNQIFFTRKFHSAIWTNYTALASATVGLGRVAVGRDTPHHFLARLRAIREGLAMAK